MNRPILVCALLLMSVAVPVAVLGAQEATQANPYEGTSNPPPDNTIVTTGTPLAKPPASHVAAPVQAPVQEQTPAQTPDQIPDQAQPPAPAQPASSGQAAAAASDPDGDIVQVQQSQVQQSTPAPEQSEPGQPALTPRRIAPNPNADPDGDIVHPQPPQPGELPDGTTIRVELLDRLSTVSSEKGDPFRGKVLFDVMQGDQVLIPAGAEIDGRLAEVSSGHPGGHGSLLLRPETVILAGGSRYMLHADLTATPGARSKVSSEGAVLPASRLKRDSIEYGGAVGAGATTGAIVGGPVGALTGTLIGAGVVTAHLLISHPQATLEEGSILEFTLSDPLQMAQASAAGN